MWSQIREGCTTSTPLLWSQIVHPPQAMAHSIYIIIRTNQEQTFTERTKQEQHKKDSFNYNDL